MHQADTIGSKRTLKRSGTIRSIPVTARLAEPLLTAGERKRKPKPPFVAKLAQLAALAKIGKRQKPDQTFEPWLNKLKVVRNDLRDSDLEVLPVKTTAGSRCKPVGPGVDASSRSVARFVQSRKLSRMVSACFAWF